MIQSDGSSVPAKALSLGQFGRQGILNISLIPPDTRQLLPDPAKPLDEGWPGPITEVRLFIMLLDYLHVLQALAESNPIDCTAYITQCFDAAALRNPDAIAIIYQDERVSYRTLQELSNRLAHAILESGLGKGHVIGLYGHRRYLLSL